MKEKHDQMLEILLAFDEFCRGSGIKYSLADGTLLGAMRHADYIPWDDDVDIMVTKEEYIKLRKALNADSRIKLVKAYFLDRITTVEYQGQKLYIDLFINEDMPASRLVFGWKKLKTLFLRTYFYNNSVLNVRHENYSRLKKTAHRIICVVCGSLISLLLGERDIFDVNENAVAIKKHKPSGFYTRFTSRMYETRRRFNKASYDEGYCDIQFRGQTLMSIKNADTFLREMYGDYTSMPPEEKRVPEHGLNMLDSPEKCLKRYN